MKAQKSIVLKRNLMFMVKKVISNQINQIKSRIMRKIRPKKIKLK